MIRQQLLIAFSVLLSSVYSQDWGWQCQNTGNCVRTTPDDNTYTTIAECRLICNKYSTLWPLPTGLYRFSRQTVPVDVLHLTVDTTNVVGEDEKAFIRTAGNILTNVLAGDCPRKLSRRRSSKRALPMRVVVRTVEEGIDLDWNVDESYSLTIMLAPKHSDCNQDCTEEVSIEINAKTIFGARHGLESLGQLTACRPYKRSLQLVMMSAANITNDAPAYTHRGLLIDTSRNFLHPDSIKRTIRAMSYSKMNVLHWHLSDSHSFPFFSSRVPNLTRTGAYSSLEVYTPDVVEDIIEYAKDRGVRVLPEIDAPAHAGNGWEWSDQAVCVNSSPWRLECIQPPCGQLDPTNEEMYNTLQLLFTDIWETFKPKAFHMGGDEVYFPCWARRDHILKWMDSHNLTPTEDGFLSLWSRFQAKALNAWDTAVGTNNTPVILWSSDLTDPSRIQLYLNQTRYVIQTWTSASDTIPNRLLQLGYRLIISTKDAWYLDHGFNRNTRYHTWNDVYDNKLPQNNQVFGGETCMWGELVADSNLDSRVWPRASCAAERLWSDPAEPSVSALPRLQNHLELLIKRGINAEVIQPEWCSQNDNLC